MSGPNYLKRVMEGVHSLTDKSIPKFAHALGLNEAESAYFCDLVKFNQAKSLEEKDKFFEKLMESKAPHSQHVLEKDQYEYYRNWYNIAIREILSFVPCKGDGAALAKVIAPHVSPKKVRESLRLLERVGLIERDEAGTYIQTSRAVTTGPDIQSLLVPKFHLSMAELAQEAVTRFSKEYRYFSSVSMSISESAYQEVINIIIEARKRVVQKVAEDKSPDRAYHLNFQLFPLSNPKTPKKKNVK